jgi:pyruvate dehydrogenase E2 component (dihydrolipoamide acetyltransferase)
MAFEFKFPDVGEGITEGELLAWKVQEGDVVAEDQTLVEVETDKAVVELPSPRAGRIAKLHVADGDVIEVGQVLVTIEEAVEGAVAATPAPAPAAESPPTSVAGATRTTPAPPPAPPVSQVEEEEEFYTGSVIGQLEEAPDDESAPASVAAPRPVQAPVSTKAAGVAAAPAPVAPGEATVKVLAMPSVRALARELGVDLSVVHGTGPGGRILRQDVEDHAEAAAYGRVTIAAPSIAIADVAEGEPWMGGTLERDQFGVVERMSVRGVRRTMARRMAESLAKQAQVTTTDDADVSILRRIREKERTLAAERGIHLTYLAFVIKACAAALQRFPRMNSILSEDCRELVIKRYYNIGIAVDTKVGLMVPNLKDADRKSIFRIAEEVIDLAQRAQDRSLALADLQGGTFTVTNYGAIGGVYGTPVTNYPEIAVLGMGRVRDLAVVRKGQVLVRQMLPLSLTYDHQVVDGAEASRFLNLVISYLEDPDLMLLEGV